VRVSDREAEGLINAERARAGLGPVRINSRLEIAASTQARLMAEADKLAHAARAGQGLPARLEQAGYVGRAGENISAGRSSLDDAIQAWMHSPGHRANMLNPDFTEFGIAAARVGPGRDSRYSIYWALILGAPA
jgi:uncharacterized protein YkwD